MLRYGGVWRKCGTDGAADGPFAWCTAGNSREME